MTSLEGVELFRRKHNLFKTVANTVQSFGDDVLYVVIGTTYCVSNRTDPFAAVRAMLSLLPPQLVAQYAGVGNFAVRIKNGVPGFFVLTLLKPLLACCFVALFKR